MTDSLEYLALLQAAYPTLVAVIACMFGLIVGSFLNVVVFRLPVMMENSWRAEARDVLEMPPVETAPFNLAKPDSRCPHCGHAIRAWENIPVVSWLALRGRCSGCGASISARYPVVEAATGLMTMLVIITLGATPAGLLGCLLTWALIALALIDYDTMYLPDDITLPFLWLGLLVNVNGVFVSLDMAVWGAILGYLSLWSVYWLFKLVTGKEGMGYGDFKLLAMLCAWLGATMLPLIIILSALAGTVIGGSLILTGRDREKPIPFGPYLATAGFLALLWGDTIVTRYLQFMAA